LDIKHKFLAHQLQKDTKYEHFAKGFPRFEYSFDPIFHKQIELSANMGPSGRLYTTPDGRKYPSITTLLSATKSEESKQSLERWKQRVGVEEANKITVTAGARGTKLHKDCEDFILGSKDIVFDDITSNSFHLFRQAYPLLKRINNIHAIESSLYSHKLKTAGRTDLIAEFDDVLSVIDFKTTRKPKEEHWIEDYFIQETAYGIMFSEMFDKKVKQIVVIMSVDNDSERPESQLFVKKAIDYVKPLTERVNKYYNNLKGMKQD